MKKNILILMIVILAIIFVGCSVDQMESAQNADEMEMSKVSIYPQIANGMLLKLTRLPSITGGLYELLVDVDNQTRNVVFKASSAKTRVTLKIGNIEKPVRISELRRGDKLEIVYNLDVDKKPFAIKIYATRGIF